MSRDGGAAVVVRETERKYDVSNASDPRLEAVQGVASVVRLADEQLDAVYFDTEDLRLIRGGVTLRERTGGADAGWHLKLPAGPDARDEIRLPAIEPGGTVPQELARLVRALARGQRLIPVASIHTIRRRRQLRDKADRPLAEIAADTVSASLTDGSAGSSWEELEVELVTGDRQFLMAVDNQLLAAGALRAGEQPKLARALGARLTRARGESGSSAHDLGPRSPAGAVVLAYLSAQIQAMTRLDPLVRRDQPDAVHQMRVATRRARSGLQVFGNVVDRHRTRPLAGELKWLAAVLGHIRDAEVLVARLEDDLAAIPAELASGPVRDRINGHFTRELAEGRAAVLHELDGPRYLAVLRAFDVLMDNPPLTPFAAQPAAKALRRPVRRAARRLKRTLADVDSCGRAANEAASRHKDEAIHQARKAAKRARYAAEAARPALGSRARRQAARTKALQSLLGDHHDSVVARAVLCTIAAQAYAAGEDSFTYGVLHGREACEARDIENRLANGQAA